jgi:hypothetical protein
LLRPRPAWPRGESRGSPRKNPPHDRGSATCLDPDVGLVYPPTVGGRFELRAQTSFHFRGVTLHPPPDGDVVDRESALSQEFLDVAVRQGKTQVPADRKQDDLRFKLAPLE